MIRHQLYLYIDEKKQGGDIMKVLKKPAKQVRKNVSLYHSEGNNCRC